MLQELDLGRGCFSDHSVRLDAHGDVTTSFRICRCAGQAQWPQKAQTPATWASGVDNRWGPCVDGGRWNLLGHGRAGEAREDFHEARLRYHFATMRRSPPRAHCQAIIQTHVVLLVRLKDHTAQSPSFRGSARSFLASFCS